MALFQYFKKVDGNYPGTKLPDPQGALSKEPSSSISVANNCTSMPYKQRTYWRNLQWNVSYGLVGLNDGNSERIAKIGRLSSAQKFFTQWYIPDLLVSVVTMDHCFNFEGRHCFLTSQLVNEHAKSDRFYRVCHVYAPIRNSLIVGMAYWAACIREIISTKFKKTAIRENFDTWNISAIW